MGADNTDKKAGKKTGKNAGGRSGDPSDAKTVLRAKSTSVLIAAVTGVLLLMAEAQPATVCAYAAGDACGYSAYAYSADSFPDSEYPLYAEPPPDSEADTSDNTYADRSDTGFDDAQQGDEAGEALQEYDPHTSDLNNEDMKTDTSQTEASQTEALQTDLLQTEPLQKNAAPTGQAATLVIACRVKGSLGDLSKSFGYTLELSGLEPGAEYPVKGKKYEAGTGFADDAFTADADGSALLQFGIQCGGFIEISGLPVDSSFAVTQQANDHETHFSAVETKSCVVSADGPPHEDLETGEIIMNKPVIYTVDFTNNRELAPLTGMPHHSTDRQMIQCLLLIIIFWSFIDTCIRNVLKS